MVAACFLFVAVVHDMAGEIDLALAHADIRVERDDDSIDASHVMPFLIVLCCIKNQQFRGGCILCITTESCNTIRSDFFEATHYG